MSFVSKFLYLPQLHCMDCFSNSNEIFDCSCIIFLWKFNSSLTYLSGKFSSNYARRKPRIFLSSVPFNFKGDNHVTIWSRLALLISTEKNVNGLLEYPYEMRLCLCARTACATLLIVSTNVSLILQAKAQNISLSCLSLPRKL